MQYLKRTSYYLEIIALFDPTHMMSMANPVAIGVEIVRIDIGCSLEIELTKLICMNPLMTLYLTVNQVDSCHICVYGPFT